MSRKEESRLTPAARAIADSREGVFIPVDLVRFTGDIVSAAFLRQLLYWFGTARDGYSRAQIRIRLSAKDRERGLGSELEEMLWLAKADDDWFDEIGLTYAQVKRVRAVFERDGWIVSLTKRFDGTPTTHIAILPGLLEALEGWYSVPADEKVKRQRLTLARSRVAPTSDVGESPTSERRESGAETNVASGLANNASPPTSDVGESLTRNLIETPNELEPRPPVASDVGPAPQVEQTPRRRKAKKEPSHPNYDAAFDVIAQAFGLDPVGLPDKTRGKVLHSRACALDAGLLDDLRHLDDVVWLFRGQLAGIPDIGTFGSACHRIATDPDELRLIPHRAEATEIVAAAIERVPELAGHCKGVTRPQAECAIATALAAGHLRGTVKTAMLTASQWTKGTLLNEIGSLRPGRGGARGVSTVVPPDLAKLDDRQLIDLLRSDPPRLDVERIGVEIEGRLMAGPGQYQRAYDVRGLIDGREGWPRAMGPANKLRMELGVKLDLWLAANRPTTPEALTRGA